MIKHFAEMVFHHFLWYLEKNIEVLPSVHAVWVRTSRLDTHACEQ